MPTSRSRPAHAAPRTPLAKDIYLTPLQVAQQLQVRPRTVQAWLRTGLLKGVKLPGSTRWRISQAEVEALATSIVADAGRSGSSPGREDEEAAAWLNADLSRLGDFEPYDWGPDGPPEGDPIFWDEASGQFMVLEDAR